jgi:hypothetical protein
MRYFQIGITILFASFSGSAYAVNPNLLENGSFETGFFTGFQRHNVPPQNPCQIGNNAAFTAGEPTGGLSSDPVGTHYLACVANPSNESLTQNVFLETGTYDVGFSAFPYSYQEPDDEEFIASVGSTEVVKIKSANSSANHWHLKNGTISISTAGYYVVRFRYKVVGSLGRDMAVDRLYIALH